MSIFSDMTSKEMDQAFEVVLFSVNNLRPWGFDFVDAEQLVYMYKKLSPYHRRNVCNAADIHSKRVTPERFEQAFYDAHEDPNRRFCMWRAVFKRSEGYQKMSLLESNEDFYVRAKRIMDETYDWSEFRCSLEENDELSKLSMIKRHWSELGTQVYGCSTNDKGKMCACLRHASNTSAYKCFRDYLEREEKTPTGAVPSHLLIG